jgi:hypothetical protein
VKGVPRLEPSIPSQPSQQNHTNLAKVQENRASIPTRRFRQVAPRQNSLDDEERNCGSDNKENRDHLAYWISEPLCA